MSLIVAWKFVDTWRNIDDAFSVGRIGGYFAEVDCENIVKIILVYICKSY